jgi:hypothetical protein
MDKSDIVQASEISLYVYCKRAWWLKHVKGERPRNLQDLEQGLQVHEAHGRTVVGSILWRYWAYFFFGLAGLSGLLFVLRLITT